MCYVLYYEPCDDEPKYVCYLHDRGSAEKFAEQMSQCTKVNIQVERFPLVVARELRIKYWEDVAKRFPDAHFS